jgi:methyltransferase (TIGR00027 family)
MQRRAFLHGLLATSAWPFFPAIANALEPATRMAEGSPSRTAQGAAVLRASHQILDRPLILDDGLALRILGPQLETSVRANPNPARAGLRAFVALRSRFAEDQLGRAVHRGVGQYVILGAGLDTFAYRNPFAASRLRVFEVDHPATQAWKLARLRDVGIDAPDSLTFVPVDFERQTLSGELAQAGFKADTPAFFSWLGVVVYLTQDAVTATLGFIASLASGTEVVFDYGIPSAALTERERASREAAAKRVAAIGEPWLTFFDPAGLAVELLDIGFSDVEDLDPQQARDRYFANRTDGLRIGNAGRLMRAVL